MIQKTVRNKFNSICLHIWIEIRLMLQHTNISQYGGLYPEPFICFGCRGQTHPTQQHQISSTYKCVCLCGLVWCVSGCMCVLRMDVV